jgi:DNA-3-methyladenine glycosylase II
MHKKVLEHFKKVDPVLFSVAKNAENFILTKSGNYFERLCKEIINQQLSDKAGDTIFGRFQKLFPAGKITPENLIKITFEKLRSAGPSGKKIEYIQDLARKVISREIILESLEKLEDEMVIAELTKLRGIGRWTAEMFLMFVLGREDIFSFGDLGLRRGLKKLYKLKKEPTAKQLEKITQKWSPYRSYASLIIWRCVE